MTRDQGSKTTDDSKTTGDSNANGEPESTGASKSTGLPKTQPSAWPIADFADEIEVQPDWESDSFGYYALNDDGTYTIMACILDDIPCMEVPAGFQGRAITGVGPQAFFYLHNVEQIRFPSTIETLSGSIFDNCDHPRAVFLPSSIREVKEPLVKHTLPESPRLVYFCSSGEDEIKERGWLSMRYMSGMDGCLLTAVEKANVELMARYRK